MLSLTSHTTKNSLEFALLKELESVDFIGELLIDEAAFQHLSEVIRRTGIYSTGQRTRVDPTLIPPALFVTSMVFCARYSNVDARNFWTPYAQLVWQRDEATLNFQNRCREHFQHCKQYLTQKFGFYFPVHRLGDVVRPVYRHALLPYYLQDNFAAWLKNNLKGISEITAESLPVLLQRDESLRYVPPTLRHFLQEEDTAEGAAALVQSMAIAANMYLDGEPIDDITALMTNPIESSIWRELFSVLVEHSDAQATQRQSRPRVEWVWSLENHEMQLRIGNIILSPEMRPDLCIWTKTADHHFPELTQQVYPWENEDGSWFVDELLLADCPINGHIVLLDERGKTLFQTPVPEFQVEPFSVFRLTQQNLFGIRVDPTHHTMNDGVWLLSMNAGFELLDETGNPISSRQTLPVPRLLAESSGHRKAGLYSFNLPVQLVDRNDHSFSLEARDANIGQPSIVGNNPVAVSPSVPPAFSDLNVQLRIPRLTERINRLTLWLKSDNGRIIHRRLQQLEREGALQKRADGYVIDLSSVLPHEPATYLINLRQGIQPVNSTPLQFSVLPNIRIVTPDQNQIYSPLNWPTAFIEGVSLPEIIVPEATELIPQENGIRIEWHDLRTNACRLRLRINQQSIPLTWNIRRVFAWVDGLESDSTVSPEQLQDATLHIRGEGKQRISLRIANTHDARTISLDAKGNYDNALRQDQLSDMVLQHRSTRVTVEVAAADIAWKLFELVHRPRIKGLEVEHSIPKKQIVLKCQVENEWSGQFDFQLRSLDRPLEDPLLLGHSAKLERMLTFRCDLRPGDYLLEITCEGQVLRVDETSALIRIQTSSLPQYNSPTNVAIALAQLSTSNVVDLPIGAIPDYLRLLSNQFSAVPSTILDPAQLSFLACQPVSVFRDISPAQLSRIWPLLAKLSELHEQETWRRHGFLPAWAVVGSPLRFRLRKQGWILKIYPEVALDKGRIGIGYVDLKLDEANKVRSRVSWRPRTDGLIRLEVAIPPAEVAKEFDKLDPLDLMPVYMCVQCGQLIAKQSGYPHNDPHLQKRHKHIFRQARFKDLVHDLELVAEFASARGQEIWYTYPPNAVVDRKYVQKYLEYPYSQHIAESSITTRNGYCRAVEDWVDRSAGNHGNATMLDTLVTNRRWQQGIKAITNGLATSPPIASVPMIAATRRLLQVLSKTNEDQPLLVLDRTILILALMMRGRAYLRAGEFTALNQMSGLEVRDWSMMLELASKACPVLLEWAFTWVELFYIHAVS